MKMSILISSIQETLFSLLTHACADGKRSLQRTVLSPCRPAIHTIVLQYPPHDRLKLKHVTNQCMRAF